MGAGAQHPPPGTEGRPSYTAVLGSVDPFASRYVAEHRAQTSKREIIEDMHEMTVVSGLVCYVLFDELDLTRAQRVIRRS